MFILTLTIARLVRSFHIISQEKAGKDTQRASKRQNRKRIIKIRINNLFFINSIGFFINSNEIGYVDNLWIMTCEYTR